MPRSNFLEGLFQECCPDSYRILRILQVDHVFVFSSWFRGTLFLCAFISLGFAVTWFADLWNLTCFTRKPWTDKGLSRYTCVYQGVGVVVCSVMFWSAAHAFVYYDGSREDLRKRKRQLREELHDQCEAAWKRASRRAGELCEMLSKELGAQINDFVSNMRAILKGHLHEAGPHEAFGELALAMARQLHHLREPVFSSYSLIPKLGGSPLEKKLEDQRHTTSMLRLLLQPSADQSWDERQHRNEEEFHDGTFCSWLARQCNCCTLPSVHFASKTAEVFREPDERSWFELREVKMLLEPPEQEPPDSWKDPQFEVLRPLGLILRWVQHLEFSTRERHGEPGASEDPRTPNLSAVFPPERAFSWQEALWTKPSRQLQLWLLAELFAILYGLFYSVTLIHVHNIMKDGKCPGTDWLRCLWAFVRKAVGLVMMLLYIGSMGWVLYNFERVDTVLELQKGIQLLQDVKLELDRLNTYALAKDEGSIQIIRDISDRLHRKTGVVHKFVLENFGGAASSPKHFQQLVQDLYSADSVDPDRTPTCMDGYTRISCLS